MIFFSILATFVFRGCHRGRTDEAGKKIVLHQIFVMTESGPKPAASRVQDHRATAPLTNHSILTQTLCYV